MAGRPTTYSAEISKVICTKLASGLSLNRICGEKGMPHRDTIYEWLHTHEEFARAYDRAREMQSDLYADQCIEIADDKSGDILEVGEGGDTRSITNSANVQRAKLQVDARKWKAAQMAPRKWGQQQVQHTGEGGGPMQVIVNVITKAIPAPSQPVITMDDDESSSS